MTSSTTKAQPSDKAADPFLWLEDRTSKQSLDWVHGQNEITVGELQGDPSYQPMFQTALDLMTAEDNIAAGNAIAGHVYNFWQDKTNALGLWRRTTVASYKTEKPQWETILDFDQLAAKEGTKWVFSGANRLYPEFSRCLLSMSPDGGDASEMREFDIETRSFIEGGFRAPASKSSFGWLDKDTVIVSSAFGEADRTESGYPRVVKLWKRGTNLDDATPIFEGLTEDLAVGAGVEFDGDKRHVFLARTLDFFASHSFLRLPSGENRRIPLPDDVTDTALFKDQLVFGVRTPWTAPDGTVCQPDGLYSLDFAHWIETGDFGTVEILLAPAHRVSIAGLARTQDRLFVNLLDNVRGKVLVCERTKGAWSTKPVALPENGTVGISHAEHFGSSVSFSFTDFLTPSSIIWSDDEGETLATVKSQPARFDASPLISEQFEARSKDGTMNPVFRRPATRPEGAGADASLWLWRLPSAAAARLCRCARPALAGKGQRLCAGLHPWRRRVRPGLASGGAQGQAPERLRRFRRCCAGCRPARHRHGSIARHPGWFEWRPADRRFADPASGALRRRHYRGAAARHASLHRTATRRFVDGGVRRSVETGRCQMACRLFALSTCEGRCCLSAGVADDLDRRRQGPSRPRAQDGGPPAEGWSR